MQFEITEKSVVNEIKKLEAIYVKKFGSQAFGFLGQLSVDISNDKVILEMGSFDKDEHEILKLFIKNRANKAFDLKQLEKTKRGRL